MSKTSEHIKCIYPNKKLIPLSKKDIQAISGFHKIVKNYMRIIRLSNLLK